MQKFEKFLLKFDRFFLLGIVSPIIGKITNKTGYSNFWVARVTLVMGIFFLELNNGIEFVTETNYASLLFSALWLFIGWRRWDLIAKIETLFEKCEGNLEALDYQIVKLFLDDQVVRFIWTLLSIMSCVSLIIFPFNVASFVDLGLVFLTFSAYTMFCCNSGGKKLHEKVKDKAKELWAKAKDLIPSPVPAPTMVMVEVYDDQYVRSLPRAYCSDHR